ncbi:MAG: hypothetical protein NTY59_07015 [Alphaproteobacteria bacterium]|nr:hypothetical protein [Alphaproteobacteria bacterium]
MLDLETRALQRIGVGVRRHMDGIAPDNGAAIEGARQDEAVPASQHTAALGAVCHGQDRHFSELGRHHDAGRGAHARATRTVGGEADDGAAGQRAQDGAQGGRPTPRGGTDHGALAEMGDHLRDHAAIAVKRYQHGERHFAAPAAG